MIQTFTFNYRSTKLCEEKCKNDQACGKTEICLNGECQEGCINDHHCKHGEKCYKNSCYTSCQTNNDCDSSDYCHIDHKVCLPRCKVGKSKCVYSLLLLS